MVRARASTTKQRVVSLKSISDTTHSVDHFSQAIDMLEPAEDVVGPRAVDKANAALAQPIGRSRRKGPDSSGSATASDPPTTPNASRVP